MTKKSEVLEALGAERCRMRTCRELACGYYAVQHKPLYPRPVNDASDTPNRYPYCEFHYEVAWIAGHAPFTRYRR